MSTTGHCTVHRDAGCVSMPDGDIIPIRGGFDRIGREVDCEHPDCVLVIAGPRANGKDVEIVLDSTDKRKLI